MLQQKITVTESPKRLSLPLSAYDIEKIGPGFVTVRPCHLCHFNIKLDIVYMYFQR